MAHRACAAASVFRFKVNNEKVAIPYSLKEHLWVILRAQRLLLFTDFEMVVDFDGKHTAGIGQGHRLQRTLCASGAGSNLQSPPSGTEAGGSSMPARAHSLSQRNLVKPKPKRKKKKECAGCRGAHEILAVRRQIKEYQELELASAA